MSVLEMPGHLIRRLHQHSTQSFVERTQAVGYDLTPVQYAALEAIYENPGSDQKNIAQLIGYDRATIGGVIERLEKKGWVRRVVSEHDRRARELSLTAQGNSIRLELQPIVKELQKDILQPLKSAHQELLINLMQEVVWAKEAKEAKDD